MKRAKFDRAAGEALGQAIRDIESQTDAEIVVVVRGRSGSYRHADYLAGLILSLAGLIFVLFSPFEFRTFWVPFDVVILFIVGAFVSSRSDLIRRLLTSKKYQAAVVRKDAAAMFYEAGIANTRSENGMIVYLSLLERRLEVIADRGILKAVPPLNWNTSVFELKHVGSDSKPDKLNKALRDLGSVLAEHMPPTGDNPNELADGPRIELK